MVMSRSWWKSEKASRCGGLSHNLRPWKAVPEDGAVESDSRSEEQGKDTLEELMRGRIQATIGRLREDFAAWVKRELGALPNHPASGRRLAGFNLTETTEGNGLVSNRSPSLIRAS
jgi:hypothetical protein